MPGRRLFLKKYPGQPENLSGLQQKFPDLGQYGADGVPHMAARKLQPLGDLVGIEAFFAAEPVNLPLLRSECGKRLPDHSLDLFEMQGIFCAGVGRRVRYHLRILRRHAGVPGFLARQMPETLVGGHGFEPGGKVFHFGQLVAVGPDLDKHVLQRFQPAAIVFDEPPDPVLQQRAPLLEETRKRMLVALRYE